MIFKNGSYEGTITHSFLFEGKTTNHKQSFICANYYDDNSKNSDQMKKGRKEERKKGRKKGRKE